MMDIFVKILVAAAILEFGLSTRDFDCQSQQCWAKLQKVSVQAVKIDWRPISVFPKEAKRFR